jgi:hypothetical protein
LYVEYITTGRTYTTVIIILLTMLNELFAPPLEMCCTAIAMVVCLAGVEFFSRNVIRLAWLGINVSIAGLVYIQVMAWLGIKVAIAGLVYIQVREFVTLSFGVDPFCVESRLFGVPPGTINAVASIGLHVAKTRVLGGIHAVWSKFIMYSPPVADEGRPGTWGWLSDMLFQ